MSNGWKYYNHALLPTAAPHEEADTQMIKDGSIWQVRGGGIPLLVRWTSKWDCQKETEWYYCIADRPLDIANLKAKRRYEHKKAAKNFRVVRINPLENLLALQKVQVEAFAAYPAKYGYHEQSLKELERCFSDNENYRVYAAYFREDGQLAGYAVVEDLGKYANFLVQKTVPRYERFAVNLALVDYMLEDFQERLQGTFYIVDGERSVNHDETHFQDYLIKYAGFRKCYCRMHIVYRTPLDLAVKLAYPFRCIFARMDGNMHIHKINALLKMEEIARSFKDEQ